MADMRSSLLHSAKVTGAIHGQNTLRGYAIDPVMQVERSGTVMTSHFPRRFGICQGIGPTIIASSELAPFAFSRQSYPVVLPINGMENLRFRSAGAF